VFLESTQKEELEKLEKYRKFEKINIKSKMICSIVQGFDGYRQSIPNLRGSVSQQRE